MSSLLEIKKFIETASIDDAQLINTMCRIRLMQYEFRQLERDVKRFLEDKNTPPAP
jgi:hypothetical protein